jgi:hypothetical protein
MNELYIICQVLQCTPFELLKVKAGTDIPLHHPLTKWLEPKTVDNPASKIRIISPDKLDKVNEFINKLIADDDGMY